MCKHQNIEKNYDPKQFEDRLYETWEKNGYFKASADSKKEPYTIVIPPPNVTGQLHMGHALDETLQDILIRYKRLSGYEALWVPGTDHAGIATQIKVEETLRKEQGLTRHDIGREKFLEMVWDWKAKYGNTITNQLKKLGSSCDWSRERFTMDEGCSKAVKEVFCNLYEKGLIYRGNRIINWCPDCATALSDAEVEYQEQEGAFWHIKYPVKDSGEFVIIATTRPETLLGDTAVAVHPDDERYKDLVGKMLILPLVGREIPVVADEYVEKDFGTGCVKITPAHDPNDFEVGKRHNLEVIKVLDDNACVNEFGGKYKGMDRYEARKAIIDDLQQLGLLVKTEKHSHNVGTCYRCGTTVEPIASQQWFVKMEPLAKPAIEVINDGTLKFVPERFSKTYLSWMENVRDWCISRQLWWGHRIPAFYCDDCGEMFVSKDELTTCAKCGGKLRQEEDVLDTWFSSALWPFSTLGWPEDTQDLKYFYPTSTLVTGYDIIFFWVARMVFSALEHTGKAPFEHVFIHGIVRDSQGRKMSKSLGNGVNPLEVIDKYGADALRFTLATGNSPGNDMRYYEERVEASRNFANKIWNASRFILMNLTEENIAELDVSKLCVEDKWIISKLNTLTKEVTENLDKFELGVAVAKLYDFIWDDLCDWYIELIKPRLYEAQDPTNMTAQCVLVYVMTNTLTLLHPFMPFITEEIWQHLPHDGETIMRARWPEYSAEMSFEKEEKELELIMDAIKAIRNTRATMNVPVSRKANLYIKTKQKDVFESGEVFFKKLANASGVNIVDDDFVLEDATVVVSNEAQILIPMGDLVDLEKEKERLLKEKQRLEAEVKRVEGKLSNQGFVAKAPAKLIEEEKEKGIKYRQMLDSVIENLEKLK
ncbi:MAG: valine--tRNA ligase [Clostridia bacterium]|nr:valine--tRNA ligase [Clostridia bacterium]